MQEIKVIYILHHTSLYEGSTQSFLIMLRKLLESNIKPIVICPNNKGIYCTLRSIGVDVRVLTYKFNAYPPVKNTKEKLCYIPKLLARLIMNELSYRHLLSIQKQFKADIIHTNVSVINIGYRVSKRVAVPHIYHIREYQDLDFSINVFPSMKTFIKKLNCDNNYSICITNGIRNHYHLNQSNSSVIYNGIMPEQKMHYDGKLIKKKYLLFVGQIHPSKNPSEVVEAFIECVKNNELTNTELWLAGSIPTNNIDYYTTIKNKIKHNKCNSLIKFLGERDDIPQLMSSARALIVSSHNEGFGRVTAEAMFNKCLVIGRDSAGTKEQFDNGLKMHGREIGLRYNNIHELMKCMKKAVNESNDSIISIAYKTVNNLYTDSIYAKKVKEVYQNIIKKQE